MKHIERKRSIHSCAQKNFLFLKMYITEFTYTPFETPTPQGENEKEMTDGQRTRLHELYDETILGLCSNTIIRTPQQAIAVHMYDLDDVNRLKRNDPVMYNKLLDIVKTTSQGKAKLRVTNSIYNGGLFAGDRNSYGGRRIE